MSCAVPVLDVSGREFHASVYFMIAVFRGTSGSRGFIDSNDPMYLPGFQSLLRFLLSVCSCWQFPDIWINVVYVWQYVAYPVEFKEQSKAGEGRGPCVGGWKGAACVSRKPSKPI